MPVGGSTRLEILDNRATWPLIPVTGTCELSQRRDHAVQLRRAGLELGAASLIAAFVALRSYVAIVGSRPRSFYGP